MAQLVSIEQAISNSLAFYLATSLPGVDVQPRWPVPSKNLPTKAVSVVPVGRRQYFDTSESFIRFLSSEEAFLTDDQGNTLVDGNGDPLIDDKHRVYTYAVAACSQALQLDVWATNDFDRDDIVARIDDALSAGLGTTIGTVNDDPFRDGPLLALSDGYSGFADFTFDGPLKDDSSDSSSRSEYRATYTGTATAHRSRKIQLPTIVKIKLVMRVAELLSQGLQTDTYTLLNTTGDLSWSIP